jgi:hypothetical protein
MNLKLLNYSEFSELTRMMGWYGIPLQTYYAIYIGTDGDPFKTINGIAMYHMLEDTFECLDQNEQIQFATRLRCHQEFRIADYQNN